MAILIKCEVYNVLFYSTGFSDDKAGLSEALISQGAYEIAVFLAGVAY